MTDFALFDDMMDGIDDRIELVFCDDDKTQETLENLLVERLASVQHEIWSHWMKFLFSQCHPLHGYSTSGAIPHHLVERWTRQMNTPYDELTDVEKESNREQARKVMAAL